MIFSALLRELLSHLGNYWLRTLHRNKTSFIFLLACSHRWKDTVHTESSTLWSLTARPWSYFTPTSQKYWGWLGAIAERTKVAPRAAVKMKEEDSWGQFCARFQVRTDGQALTQTKANISAWLQICSPQWTTGLYQDHTVGVHQGQIQSNTFRKPRWLLVLPPPIYNSKPWRKAWENPPEKPKLTVCLLLKVMFFHNSNLNWGQ